MVRVKNRCNKCCSDCANRPTKEWSANCAYCLCDSLCVTMTRQVQTGTMNPCNTGTGTGDCGCETTDACGCNVGYGELLWDSQNCYWSGTVSCGNTDVDLIVDPKVCDGTCYLCVTSTCLNMNGGCNFTGTFDTGSPITGTKYPETGTGSVADCWAVDSHGDYLGGCVSKSAGSPDGFTFEFEREVDGCGDQYCTEPYLFEIRCRNVVNPLPSDGYCVDCDCTCECVCLTYEQEGCSVTKEVCWDGSKYQTTFTNDRCGWNNNQTVTITMQVGSDGCCYWRLAVTEGSVNVQDKAAECPDPTITWDITLGTGTGTFHATLTMACADCEGCRIDTECCPYSSLPSTLYFFGCHGPDNCPDSCIPLTYAGETADVYMWYGCGDLYCNFYPSGCTAFEVCIELLCYKDDTGGTIFEVNFYCGGTLSNDSVPSGITCIPLCITGTTSSNFTSILCSTVPDGCDDTAYDYCISEINCA